MANPSTTTPAVDNMREDWAIVDALMGGTKAMRKAGTQFLPKWPKEDATAYGDRLALSTLFPAYSETIGNMTGRVFAEPILVESNVPANIAEMLDNIDNQKSNLQVWAREQFKRGLSHGMTFVMVDFPETPEGATLADQKAMAARPYAIEIKPEQVLGWKTATVNGAQVLSQFRYKEYVEEEDPENEFAYKCIEQVRVLEPGKWRTYRATEKDGSYALYDEGATTLSYVPVAVFYTKRTGFMTATPPLMELAHLNIKHWQSQSDQDNILHVARVPIFAMIGVDQAYGANEPSTEATIGSNTALMIPMGGDAKFVEHSGQAITSGQESLNALLDEMRMAGAKMLQREKQANKTATQSAEESAQELSPLEAMAEQFEDFLENILQMFADWLGLPDGGELEVRGNFEIDQAADTSVPTLLNMSAQGKLSNQTLYEEYQRRGVISSDRSWDDEQERLAVQGPELGMILPSADPVQQKQPAVVDDANS